MPITYTSRRKQAAASHESFVGIIRTPARNGLKRSEDLQYFAGFQKTLSAHDAAKQVMDVKQKAAIAA